MKLLWVCGLGSAMMLLGDAADFPDAKAANIQTVVKRNWIWYRNHYLIFVCKRMTWAEAEKHCLSIGGNLASVHSYREYQSIRNLIRRATHRDRLTWIGGSDAQQNNLWFWSDGTPFQYSYWCRGEPNNGSGQQHCLQINYTAKKCWDDLQCHDRLPSVCAKKGLVG